MTHDRLVRHFGTLPATLVALSAELDPTLTEGMTIEDVLFYLDERILALENAGDVIPSFTVDAAILKTILGDIHADAIIVAAGGTVTGTWVADAILRAIIGQSLTADAAIKRTTESSLSSDAVMLATSGQSLDINAIFLAAAGASFASDAVLLSTAQASISADAYLVALSERLDARWDNFWHRGQSWYGFGMDG